MKKTGVWCAVLALLMALTVPVQQITPVTGEIITRDLPHQY